MPREPPSVTAQGQRDKDTKDRSGEAHNRKSADEALRVAVVLLGAIVRVALLSEQ